MRRAGPRVVRRWGVVTALAAAVLLSPGMAHAECSAPELPVVGCVAPGPSASPTPEATPEPAASPTAQTTPTAPEPLPGAVLTGGPVALPAADLTALLVPAPQAPATLPAMPVLAPRPVMPRPLAMPAALPSVAIAATPVTSPLAGTLASSFALVVFGLLALPLLLGFLAGLSPTSSPTSSRTAPHPGGTMKTTRTRLWTGLGVLGVAALVGGIGWYRISGEPLLNRQIPFLASAGILVVLLSVLGGALIVAEQLRGDQDRIGELEEAVRSLTEALSPLIEQPARRPEVAAVRPQRRGRSLPADAGRT